MYIEELKVTKERIPILIGKNGSIRKQIELRTKTRVKIDSKEGDIQISSEDPLNIYTTKLIINAISRGFNPEIAYQLLKEDFGLEIISLPEVIGKNKSKIMRQRARVIGEKGKCKHTIEFLTHTNISVQGKTVSIIGPFQDALVARKAIEKLIQGSKHGNVYRWIEQQEVTP